MRSLRQLVGWLVVLALVAAPAYGAWWVVERARSSVEVVPPPVWVAATSVGESTTEATVVVATWERQPDVVAPAWTGLVQQVLLGPGDLLSNGSPVALVDGIVRIAVQTEVPISRVLERGARGPDVSALNGLLAARGLPASPEDTFGSSTAAGVEELAEQLGAGDTEVFDPGWVLYLPLPNAVVASVALAVAQPVPDLGASVVAVEPLLLSARAVPAEAAPEPDSGTDPLVSAPAGGRPVEPIPLDPALFYQDLPAGTVVEAGEVELGAMGEDGALSPEALGVLAEVIEPGASRLPALLREPSPAGAVTVPSAAVVTDPTGATCVLRRDGPGSAPVSAAVDVLDSFLGVSTVVGIEPGVEVLVNPPARSRQSCRSS